MLSLEGKRRKLTHNAAPDFGNNETPPSHVPTDDGSPSTKISDTIKEESYWDSPESKHLFQPEENKKVLNALLRRMSLLKVAITTHDGYQKIIKEVKHADNDNDDACKISLTKHDIFFIRKMHSLF